MFIALKIIQFFLRPVIWIVLSFLISIILKNPSRKSLFFKIGFFALIFFTNPFIIRKLIQAYELKPVYLNSQMKYNAGIVLGGFVSYNLNDDHGYFNHSADRFIQTAILYKTGHIKKIIVAAGNGYIITNNFKEAIYIKEYLVALGIPSDDIYTDSDSRNTKENAINSKKIIDSSAYFPTIFTHIFCYSFAPC